MTELAWMKTWIGDEAAKIRPLTTEEFGAYELLRRQYWTDGCLPNDDERLRRITGVSPDRWPEVRSSICGLFEEGWRLPALDAERGDATEKRAKAIVRSQKAAEARWGKNASRNATRNAPSTPPSISDRMPEAMLEECPPAPAPDEVRYDERLAPTHAHARTREADQDVPLDPPDTEDEARAFLKRQGLGPKGIAQAIGPLMGHRLYRDVLDQIAMQWGAA